MLDDEMTTDSVLGGVPVGEDADQPVFPFPLAENQQPLPDDDTVPEEPPVDYGVNVRQSDIDYDKRNRDVVDTDENEKAVGSSINTNNEWVEGRRRFAIEQATKLNFDNVTDLLEAADQIVTYIQTGTRLMGLQQIPLTLPE